MAQRKDWGDLKREFLQGPWIKVADFLRDKGLRDSGNTRARTKGWADERRSLQAAIDRDTQDAIKRKTVESHVSILARHKKIWKAVEIMALRHLEEARKAGKAIDAHTLKKLAETLKLATEGERLANGLSTAKTETETRNPSLDALLQQRMEERGIRPPIDAEVVDVPALPELPAASS